ncbi:MAG: 50S ribosomal protein L19 [Chthoniobacterales bacterium]
MNIIETIEKEQFKKEDHPFNVGDSVKVHTRVIEGDKERIQIFAGIVIGHKGRGLNESFTVRRVAYGEGVERVFPIHSPRISKVEVERKGEVRRAKLYYLRNRKGKSATNVKEKSDRTVAAKSAAKSAPVEAATTTEVAS